ncbi:MAG: Uma2 family endonuclease, partial [Polyangiales bacterium]
MAAALSRPPVQPEEQRLLLHGISWAEYEKFVELFDEHRGVHLTYLCGALEIMTTSRRHEVIKKRIARLVEAWSEEKRVDLRGYGSPTFKKAAKERGLRPDDCYVIGECEEGGAERAASRARFRADRGARRRSEADRRRASAAREALGVALRALLVAL